MRRRWNFHESRIAVGGVMIFIMGFLIFIVKLNVFAVSVYSEGYFQYTMSEEEIAIRCYFGAEENVVIPEKIAGRNVTAIEDGTFDGCPSVKCVTVPYMVTDIGEEALSGAVNLQKVVMKSDKVKLSLPEGVTLEEDYLRYAPKEVSVLEEEKDAKQADKDTTEQFTGQENSESGVITDNTSNSDEDAEITEDFFLQVDEGQEGADVSIEHSENKYIVVFVIILVVVGVAFAFIVIRRKW